MKNKTAFLLCASALRPLPRFENTLEVQKTKITALEADLAKANATIAARDASIVERDATITEITASRDAETASAAASAAASATEVTRLTGELEKANATITASNTTIDTLKAEATTTEKKASRLLAANGHAALKITPHISESKVEQTAVTRKGVSKLQAVIEAGLEKSEIK